MSGYLNVKLQRLQNCALRFVYRLRRDTRIVPYRQKANWLTIPSRRQYFLGNLTYQILSTSKPPYLFTRFVPVDESVRRSLRLQPSHFVLPFLRTNSLANSFWIRAIQFWNSLPPALHHIPSPAAFRTAIFAHLFNADRT
ncbi:hypothetical protein ALC62_03228 [Cyphomyrmex costatus]|uniref:Uncharacterized protein n=1 Tax=Cyphomyrmex costatus TaxID=456900 RepID=A0A151IM45_9HYME|nr:hypothetical protein ALC62_03228 [Cyphomyrmex costatus]